MIADSPNGWGGLDVEDVGLIELCPAKVSNRLSGYCHGLMNLMPLYTVILP